jgi:hypothetical protein
MAWHGIAIHPVAHAGALQVRSVSLYPNVRLCRGVADDAALPVPHHTQRTSAIHTYLYFMRHAPVIRLPTQLAVPVQM